jgi:hypothetical protein
MNILVRGVLAGIYYNITIIQMTTVKVNILANSTWSGLLSYFQGIKIKRFTFANSTWSGLLSYFQGIKIKRFTKW